MKFRSWILAPALLSLGVAPALAQDGAAQKVQRSGVTVTATKVERELEEIPYSVGVVDSEEIVRRGAQSVAEALRDIPGVEVHDGSVPGAKRVFIRGESGSRVLILVDGQRVSEQKSMTGAVFLIDPNMIERIEVIKGPASVLYGSEAIGGVVNIITKKGGDRPLQLDAAVTFDSSTDGWREFLSLYGKLGEFGYRVAGTLSDQGDRKTPEGRASTTAHESFNGSVYLDYQWDKASVAASYEVYDSSMEVFTPSSVLSFPIVGFYQDLPEWSREKYSVFFEARDLFGPLVKLSGNAHQQNLLKDFVMEMDLAPGGPIQVQTRNRTKNDQDSYGAQLQSDWLLGDAHYLIFGLDYQQDDLVANETRRSRTIMPMNPNPPFNEAFYRDQARSQVFALYLQDDWTLRDDLVLTAGVRQTWISTELKSSTNSDLQPGKSSDDNLVGSLGLVWRGLPDTALRALYAQGYRYATLQQLFMGTVHGSSEPTFGNPDLDPETSHNLEFGARYDNGRLLLDGAVFGSLTKDYITTAPFSTALFPNARRFDNVDEATTYGAEVEARYLIASLDLTPHASATLLRRKFESAALNTWKTGKPFVSGRAGVRFEQDRSPNLGWYLDPYVRFATRAKEELASGGVDEDAGWMTVNLDAGVRFGADQRYRLALSLNNLADKTYFTAQESVPMAGRHVVVGLSGEF